MATSFSVAASWTTTRTPAIGAVVAPSVIRPLMAKLTVTWKERVAELPAASTAVQVTVVIPHTNALPEA